MEEHFEATDTLDHYCLRRIMGENHQDASLGTFPASIDPACYTSQDGSIELAGSEDWAIPTCDELMNIAALPPPDEQASGASVSLVPILKGSRDNMSCDWQLRTSRCLYLLDANIFMKVL